MIQTAITNFSKVILSLVGTVAVVGGVTAAVSMTAEKNLNTVKKVSYKPKGMHAQRGSLAEGLYWELEDIVTMSDSVEVGRYTLITDILQNLPNYGASYYYSFNDNCVLGFLPLDDPAYAIDLWQRNVSGEFSILKEMVPVLRSEYSEYLQGKDQSKVSDRFKKLCESLGVPFPSIACTSYQWFDYQGLGTSMPSDSNLKIEYLDSEKMNLVYGNSTVLHYVRIKELPQKVAPITLYFQEKNFFFENYDKLGLETSQWTPSDQEIDAHFRKTFKSKKY